MMLCLAHTKIDKVNSFLVLFLKLAIHKLIYLLHRHSVRISLTKVHTISERHHSNLHKRGFLPQMFVVIFKITVIFKIDIFAIAI